VGGVPIAGQDAAKPHADDVRVVTRDVKFVPKRLTAEAGEVGIYVKNDDLFWHTLTIDGLHVDKRIATAGRQRIQLRGVAPGTYRFVCAIPGHESAGMTGTLVVT
jgi:plastocyanin